MSKKRYTFTVITPAYNAEAYIEECIKSVANAEYDLNLVEHIIVDDGSKDKTTIIVQEWADKYPHIKLYKKENGNWGSVLNYVKKNKLVHNDYVIVLDSDDQITPNAFKTVCDKCKDVDLFVGGFLMTDKKYRFILVSPYLYLFKRNLSYRWQGKRRVVLSNIAIPCNTYFKSNIFYLSDDVAEGVSYQDGPFYANLTSLAKTGRFTYTKVAKYWKYRPGNTMTSVNTESVAPIFTNNFTYICGKGYYEPAVYWLTGNNYIRKYMRQNNIKYVIHDKMSFKWMPIFARWVVWLMYIFWLRRYFKKAN